MEILWGYWLFDMTMTLGWLLIGYYAGKQKLSPRTAGQRIAILIGAFGFALLMRVLLAVFFAQPSHGLDVFARDFLIALPCSVTLVYVANAAIKGVSRVLGREKEPRTRWQLWAVAVLLTVAMVFSMLNLLTGWGDRTSSRYAPIERIGAASDKAHFIWYGTLEYRHDHGRWPSELSLLVSEGYIEDLRNPRYPERPDGWVYYPPPEGKPLGVEWDLILLRERDVSHIEKNGVVICDKAKGVRQVMDPEELLDILDKSWRQRLSLEAGADIQENGD